MLRRNNGRNTRSLFTAPRNSQKPKSSETLKEEIRKKAYELYEKRGRTEGNDLEDWLEAERLVRSGRF